MRLHRLACALALTAASQAQASGFQLVEQNASGLGNAYAGSAAVADDASTIFFNPAGMTELRANEISLGLAAVRPSFRFTDDGSSAGALAGSGTGGDAGSWAAIPNAYYTRALDYDVHVGIGLSAPFGLKTEYDTPWLGGAQSQMFDIKTLNLNPSIAWRVNDAVSIGMGLNVMHMEAEYKRLAAVTSAQAASTLLDLTVDDNALGWNLGALFKPSNQTRIGLSYRSQVRQHLEGTIAVTGTLAGFSNALTTGSAKIDLTLPDTLILSLVHQLNGNWQLLGDLSRTGWSSVDQVDIVRTSGPLTGNGYPISVIETGS